MDPLKQKIEEEYPDVLRPADSFPKGVGYAMVEEALHHFRKRNQIHHYLERDLAIEELESALYWLDRLRQRQQEESLGAK